MYTLTRRSLIVDSEPSHDRSYNKFTSSRGRRGDAHNTTITADPKSRKLESNEDTLLDRDGSTDSIVQPGVEMAPIGKVYQETTIEITHEPAFRSEGASERFSNDNFNEAPSRTMWRE